MIAVSVALSAWDVLAVLGVLAFGALVAIGVVVLLAAFAPRSWVRACCRLLAIPLVSGDQHPVRIARDIQQHRFVDQAARFGVFEIPEEHTHA